MYDEPGGKGLHGFQSHQHTEDELRRSTAAYYGMISLIDQEIGRILDYIDQAGIADNTLIVFTTDHGHLIGQHGLIAKGAFHYEDLLRVPMFARYPGHVPAGQVSDAIQRSGRLSAEFLGRGWHRRAGRHAGCEPIPSLVRRSRRVRVTMPWSKTATIRPPCSPRTLVTERYKITVHRNADYGELFDLETDPGEVQNRWDDPAYQTVKGRCCTGSYRQR